MLRLASHTFTVARFPSNMLWRLLMRSKYNTGIYKNTTWINCLSNKLSRECIVRIWEAYLILSKHYEYFIGFCKQTECNDSCFFLVSYCIHHSNNLNFKGLYPSICVPHILYPSICVPRVLYPRICVPHVLYPIICVPHVLCTHL